nr:pentapeptide repeat protein [uncultured bacterium]
MLVWSGDVIRFAFRARSRTVAMDQLDALRTADELEDAVIEDGDLQSANLDGKQFSRCTFRRIACNDSSWNRARFEDCVFESCDLSRIRTVKLALRTVTFKACRVMGVDWSDLAPNPDCTFEGCNLQYSSFIETNLIRTAFLHCRLVDVNFVACRLNKVNFAGSDLSGATFDSCDLSRAVFSDAIGLYFDPAKNKSQQTRISVATAVVLARSLGLRVTGFDDDDPPDDSPRRRAARVNRRPRSTGVARSCRVEPSPQPTRAGPQCHPRNVRASKWSASA